jgi:hypothetical protein
MKLSDVVAGAGLSAYAVAALLIFFAVFIAVVLRVLFSARINMEKAARLPFDDGAVSQSSTRDRAE